MVLQDFNLQGQPDVDGFAKIELPAEDIEPLPRDDTVVSARFLHFRGNVQDGDADEERHDVSLLFFACVYGDENAAQRLVNMGFSFHRFDFYLNNFRLLVTPDSDLGLPLDLDGELRPAHIRLEVAMNTVWRLFAAAVRRRFAAVDVLLPPELRRRVDVFVPLASPWSACNEGMREGLWILTGFDPLADLIRALNAVHDHDLRQLCAQTAVTRTLRELFEGLLPGESQRRALFAVAQRPTEWHQRAAERWLHDPQVSDEERTMRLAQRQGRLALFDGLGHED